MAGTTIVGTLVLTTPSSRTNLPTSTREDHPATLNTQMNLCTSYAALNRHIDAIELGESTLKTQKIEIGTPDPDTMGAMFNLANCYHFVGKLAVETHEEALALRRSHLGLSHPDTLTSTATLAWLL